MAAKKKIKWNALLGNVLEYGDTGFSIRLNAKRKGPSYKGYDPEGRKIMTSGDLQDLKFQMEQAALDREEFTCKDLYKCKLSFLQLPNSER